jgi:hypothetical protein
MLCFGHALLWLLCSARLGVASLGFALIMLSFGHDLVMIWSCVGLIMLCFGHAWL